MFWGVCSECTHGHATQNVSNPEGLFAIVGGKYFTLASTFLLCDSLCADKTFVVLLSWLFLLRPILSQ